MKKIILVSTLFIFSSLLLGQESSYLLAQGWKNYYFPYGSSSINSLILYGNTHFYDVLEIKKDFFPWENGFYLWYDVEKDYLTEKIILALNFVMKGDTFFIFDEGFWDANFYGYNFDKNFEGGLSFAKIQSLEYEISPYEIKLKIVMPEDGFYNQDGRNIIKGIVLLGSNEFNSYFTEDYEPVLYLPYYQEETLQIKLNSIPFKFLTYTFLVDDGFSKNLKEFPPLPLVAKPIIMTSEVYKLNITSKLSLKRNEKVLFKALVDKGVSKIEWKYNGEVENREFVLFGGFDGENYYFLDKVKGEDFIYYDGEYYYFSFEHFLGERASGVFYKIELKDWEDNLVEESWTRARQK